MEIKITSAAFRQGEMIPRQYTCDGADLSPPRPPGGTHGYFFKIYALDQMLGLDSGTTKAQLLKAMEGRILAQGQLMGRYRR